MAKVTIDGKEYDTDALSENARAQLASLQFCNAELTRLQLEIAAFQAARSAYGMALGAELNKSPEADQKVAKDTATKDAKKDPDSKKGKKKGLFDRLMKS